MKHCRSNSCMNTSTNETYLRPSLRKGGGEHPSGDLDIPTIIRLLLQPCHDLVDHLANSPIDRTLKQASEPL